MKYVLVIFVFACSLRLGATIRCYDCNSVNNSMCLDPTLYDQDTLQKYLKTTSCEQGILNDQNHPFFCRKIIQTILRKGHDSEVRVTRGCGWVRHHRDCYKADNEDHLETVCQCFQDNCNSGYTVKFTLWSMLTALSTLALTRL